MFRFVLVVLIALELAGCMSTPNNGDRLGSTSQSVSFQGYWIQPSVMISIQQATSATGVFATVATATSSATGVRINGRMMYSWQARAVLKRWARTPCGNGQTFVRARAGGISLPTFDAANLTGGTSGAACATELVGDGSDPVVAALSCASSASPVVRLLAGTATHVGDVELHSQAEADALECYTHIDGSLTIADDPSELSISLPHLEEVTGALSIAYSRDPAGPNLGPMIRKVSLPLLESVGTDVELSYSGTPSDTISFDVGLTVLTSVGGSVSVTMDTFNATLRGIPELETIPGDLNLVSSGDDFYAFNFLPALTHVQQDVLVESGNSTGNVLQNLETIDGSLVVSQCELVANNNFSSLVTVGGDLILDHAALRLGGPSPHHFEALESVGGELAFEQVDDIDDLRLGAATGLSVGALTLHSNPDLSALSAAPIEVASGGPITIVDNPSLCQSTALAFVDAQEAAGWMGVATVTNNQLCLVPFPVTLSQR